MRNTFKLAALLVAAGLSAAAMTTGMPTTSARLGQVAPAFTLSDQNGKPVTLSEYSGKIVVLAWFNRECPFIKRHLSANTFTTLASKYKDKDVVVLGIDSTHTHSIADDLKAVQELGLNFPLLNDAAGTVGHAYDAKTTPEMYVIGKDGALAYEGAIDNDPQGTASTKILYVDQAVDQLLAGKAVTTPETKSYGCGVKYAQ